MRRVLIVLTDGLRPDAIDATRMPALMRLATEYASATCATTVRPSTTVSALSTLTTGVAPATHGLLKPGPDFLSRLSRLRPLPRELDKIGLKSRILASDLSPMERGLLRVMSKTAGIAGFACVGKRARDVASAALGSSTARQSGLFFIYVNDADRAGHTHGWMSPEYLEATIELDVAIGLLAPLAADSLIIVLADHGGGGVTPTTHGEPHPLNDRIPLIFAGPRVTQRYRIPRPVSILDVPPSICQWLGLPVPHTFEGQALDDVVTADAAAAEIPA